ncbi:MAG TPA: GNAT family N-acetyltransferase [Miltoncostaeaceae bacterium]|nr:GNAT family N-acetyltransferase [Miltoncostaeaceae bacterium]
MRPHVAHTADLPEADLAAARSLLYAVFDDLTEDDWEHCLGGVHALVREGDAVVAHGAVVMRRLLHGGRALRTGYVEGVAVHPDRRGRGYGAGVMDALERVIRGAYDLGALGSTDEAREFYARRGWIPWRGPTFALTPTGVVRTADDDDALFVVPGAVTPDVAGPITCDWRGGDVW